jgi:2-polyprenyl-6-methoxyphenol hydroxylase-like FAD-dependent oxidoreductase
MHFPSHIPSHDVVIAGAGPVGLFLAGDLALAGCSVLVLEQAQKAHSFWKELPFGLRGLTAPSMESLDQRGLLAPLKEQAARRGVLASAHWTQATRRSGGHFAGIPFNRDQVDTAAWPYPRDVPTELLAVDMASLETILCARAVAAGVQVVRGHAVEALEPSAAGVTVRAGDTIFHGRWLVGCDGGRSTVRKLAGFGFAGTEPEFTGYSILATLSATDPGLTPGRHYTADGIVTYQPPGTIALADFDGGACHRTCLLTLQHVQTVLRRVSGIPVTLTDLSHATTWTDRAFQATAYRRGRVVLAGDAAHIHSPLGGQGLNLGLGDAANLGWKLATVIRGDAPDTLLDSYGQERHPVAARVLDWSRAQVALMRPDPGSRALAAVMRDLIATRDGATYMAGRVWGVCQAGVSS